MEIELPPSLLGGNYLDDSFYLDLVLLSMHLFIVAGAITFPLSIY